MRLAERWCLYRCSWRDRLPARHDDRPLAAAARCAVLPADMSHQRPPTSHHGDEDVEPIYATISEIADSINSTGVLMGIGGHRQLFDGLFHVFADLAALPAAEPGDGRPGSMASTTVSPPPTLTDAPAVRRGTMPQPIAGRVGSGHLSYTDHQRHTDRTPPRFFTYC